MLRNSSRKIRAWVRDKYDSAYFFVLLKIWKRGSNIQHEIAFCLVIIHCLVCAFTFWWYKIHNPAALLVSHAGTIIAAIIGEEIGYRIRTKVINELTGLKNGE